MSTPTNHWKLGLFVVVGVGVAMVKVVVDCGFQLGHALEPAAPDALVRDLGEEPLDEVEP